METCAVMVVPCPERPAVRVRDSFGISDPVWSLIGFFAHGRLLAPPRPLRS